MGRYLPLLIAINIYAIIQHHTKNVCCACVLAPAMGCIGWQRRVRRLTMRGDGVLWFERGVFQLAVSADCLGRLTSFAVIHYFCLYNWFSCAWMIRIVVDTIVSHSLHSGGTHHHIIHSEAMQTVYKCTRAQWDFCTTRNPWEPGIFLGESTFVYVACLVVISMDIRFLYKSV